MFGFCEKTPRREPRRRREESGVIAVGQLHVEGQKIQNILLHIDAGVDLQQLEAAAEYEVAAYYPAQGLSHDGAANKSLSLAGRSFYGDELMYSGLEVPKIDTDFAAYMWILERK